MRGLLVVASIFALSPWSANAEILVRHYPGFTLHFDCKRGGPVIASYRLGPDTGNVKRHGGFRLDRSLPPGCRRQRSASSYKTGADAGAHKYDRGHLVPANHLDHDKDAIRAGNVMSNIVPQERSFNQSGAWKETEKRIECWRDEGDLRVWIGVMWGHDAYNDHFLKTHGIETPDTFVKLVYRPRARGVPARAVAWVLPNEPVSAHKLDDHRVSPRIASVLIGIDPNLDDIDVDRVGDDWPVPQCDPG